MPRLALLHVVVLSSIGLVACSKKTEPLPEQTVQSAPTPPPPSAPEKPVAEATEPPPREFDFSGKSSNTGPASEPGSVQTGKPEATPSGQIEVQMPVLVEYYPPFYPLSDRMKGFEGRIAVGLFVTQDGTVESPTIVSSTIPAYAEEALKAAATWRFIPALHEGKPIRFPVTIPLSFVSEFGTGGMPPGSPLENLVSVDGRFYVVEKDGRYTPANLDVTPLTRVQPAYKVPAEMSELRVVLKFKVNEEGRVLEPEISESSKTDFDQAALKAIRFWQFLPKIKDGKPVVASAKLPLRISK